MFIGDEANPFKADREDFRDEIERLEAEQATFLAAFEDDGKVVAGPEAWFQNSPWNAASFRLPHAFARRAELSVDREKQGEPAGVPGMVMMADSAEDPEQAFRDAASQHGITLPTRLDSKKIQRFDPATGNLKSKNKSGFCRFYTDGLPGGFFGDWASGVNEKWTAANLNGSTLTEQERLDHHRRVTALQRERDLEEQRRWKAVSKEAADLQKGSEPAPDSHPYLLDKKVRAYGLRVHKDHPGKLFMFLQDVHGIIWSYQTIDEKGQKLHAKGGRKDGLFFIIGGPIDPAKMTFVGEGFATMATVHEATGQPAIAAGDKDNLVKVAKALREVPSYKKAPFKICADSDAWTGHPGEEKGAEAANAIGAPMATPAFTGPRVYGQTDFNDLYRAEGLDAVRRCLLAAVKPTPGAEPSPAAARPAEPAGQAEKAEKLQAAIDHLATLSPAECEVRREPVAAEHGVRKLYIDKEVEKARRKIAAAQQKERFAGAAGSAYVTKPGLPPDNIGAIAEMELETAAKGQVISKSYVNAAISIAKHLGIRGKHDIFKDRHWIVFKGKLVEVTDPLIRTIQAEVAKDLGTDGGIGNVTAVLHYLCELNPFHPVRDHLTTRKWDRTERMKDWLEKTFGCEEPPKYLAAVGRMFLISMVARIMQPGCQADYKLIIEGEQGLMKSSALRTLAVKAEWFSDALPKLGRDEVRVSMHMKGLWLIEVAEMHATGKADNEEVKTFITRRVERYVSKYGRVVSDEPRECIFAGTTNRDGYFTDETGARRYWPIYAHKVDLEWLKENLDQLWAEAVHAYENGEHWWPEKKFEDEVIKPQQGDRREEPALAQPIRGYLNKQSYWPVGESGVFQFEIWKSLKSGVFSPRPDIDYTDKDLKGISKALKYLGYTNDPRRYPKGSDPARKWWPPKDKMAPEIKNELYPSAEPPPPFMEPTLCDDGCSDFDAGENA